MSTLPNARHGRVDDRLHVVRPRHVAQHPVGREPARAHLAHGRRQPFRAPRAQHQRRAGFRQSLGHLQAEPARAAGHDRDAAREGEQVAEGWHRQAYTSHPRHCQLNRRVRLCRRPWRPVPTTTVGPDAVFVREDLTEEQRLFGRTAAFSPFTRRRLARRRLSHFTHERQALARPRRSAR